MRRAAADRHVRPEDHRARADRDVGADRNERPDRHVLAQAGRGVHGRQRSGRPGRRGGSGCRRPDRARERQVRRFASQHRAGRRRGVQRPGSRPRRGSCAGPGVAGVGEEGEVARPRHPRCRPRARCPPRRPRRGGSRGARRFPSVSRPGVYHAGLGGHALDEAWQAPQAKLAATPRRRPAGGRPPAARATIAARRGVALPQVARTPRRGPGERPGPTGSGRRSGTRSRSR